MLFSLVGMPWLVGRRMHPNPRIEASQSSFPDFLYCIRVSTSMPVHPSLFAATSSAAVPVTRSA